MKNKSISSILFALLAVVMVSCNSETVSDFSQTPTERTNARIQELGTALKSSPFGWKAVYFTDDKQVGGFTFLFKFNDEKNVEMASDFDTDTDMHASEYQITMGSTVSLVFTSKNKIHLLSDSGNYPTSALRGEGYKGDFQFLYYGKDKEDLLFKSNRSLVDIRFVKATAQDWLDLYKNRFTQENVIGDPTKALYRYLETVSGSSVKKYGFSYDIVARFATTVPVEASYPKYNFGIGYTSTGIVVSPAIEIDGQKISKLDYDAATGNFIGLGTNGVSVGIKYSDQPVVQSDFYKQLLSGGSWKEFQYIDSAMSGLRVTTESFSNEIININANLVKPNVVNRFYLEFNQPDGNMTINYIRYRFVGRGPQASVYHYVTVSEGPNKTVVLKSVKWSYTLGGPEISPPNYLIKLDNYFLDPKGLYVEKMGRFSLFDLYTFAGASAVFRVGFIGNF